VEQASNLWHPKDGPKDDPKVNPKDGHMPKVVLVAGASGLVGYAAMRHFSSEPDCEVIAVSRRRPDTTFGARHIAADLTDAQACADVFGRLEHVTHVIYAALYERPDLIAGWRNEEQIAINDRMLRNLLDPLEKAARGLAHIGLLQGTKAYGSHVRPMKIPAREGRSEMREEPNFYWNQEAYLREKQRDKGWSFSIFRPVLIVGYSQGSAMNVIPAIGVYAAILKQLGKPLTFPGGPPRVAQAVDADLLARCMAWAGDASAARGETFNVANGDVYCWQNVWPAIADALGMVPGEAVPCSLNAEILPREAEWANIRRKHNLVSPDLGSFVGLSFQYADYQMGYCRTTASPPSFSSTIKLMQAGFHEVMDTETMFVKWFRHFQDKRLLPRP
jgi:nucleoside-diphosphate-sugar epimerase